MVALCRALPEAQAERAGVQHLAFKVRKKIFGYYVYDHHRDGRIALLCKAPPGEQGRLLEEDPDRYFFPPYVGPKGWVGFRLDTPRVDWKVVKSLVFVAYFLTAPDKLRKRSRKGRPVRSGRPRRRQTMRMNVTKPAARAGGASCGVGRSAP